MPKSFWRPYYEECSMSTMNKDNFNMLIKNQHKQLREEYKKFLTEWKNNPNFENPCGGIDKEDHEKFNQCLLFLNDMRILARLEIISITQEYNLEKTILHSMYKMCARKNDHRHYDHVGRGWRKIEKGTPLSKVYFGIRIKKEDKEARELVEERVIEEFINKQKEEFSKCCEKLQVGNTQLPEILEEKIKEYI